MLLRLKRSGAALAAALASLAAGFTAEPPPGLRNHIVLCGFGRVGGTGGEWEGLGPESGFGG